MVEEVKREIERKKILEDLRTRYADLFTSRQRALQWDEVERVNVKILAGAWKTVLTDEEFESAFGHKKADVSDTYPGFTMGMSTNGNPEGKFLADVFNALPILLGLASEKTSS